MFAPPLKFCVLFRPGLGRRDKVRILPERLAAHAPIKKLDRIQAKSGPNLNERHLVDVVVGSELLFFLVQNLIVAEVYALV